MSETAGVYERRDDGAAGELERQREKIAAHLNIVAGKPQPCRGCHKLIWFVLTKNRRHMPVEEDLTPHHATCPKADRFRS